MKNGQIIEDGGKKRMYLNGAYFIHEPIKGNIKSLIESDIDTLYKMALILSQAGKNKS